MTLPSPPTAARLRGMRAALLAHYEAHCRALPWRTSRDPYAIWISEIMLQQTQVDTVVPRYRQFLRQFPSIASLARAETRTVCEAWAGLGYYSRARNLHKAAQVVLAQHGGHLPADVSALRALPGIGPYTAGAIASIAFDLCAPLVDGNVARVLSRLFALPAAPESTPGKQALWALAALLVEGPKPGLFNQALMELGSQICTPRAPDCPACPVRRRCCAWATQAQTRYPTPKVRPAKQVLPMALAWWPESGGLWLNQRPLQGLWAGLWELPSASGAAAKAELAAQVQQPLGPALTQVVHLLTHRRVEATVYAVRAPGPLAAQAPPSWRLSRDPLQAPLSTLARRCILAVLAQQSGAKMAQLPLTGLITA